MSLLTAIIQDPQAAANEIERLRARVHSAEFWTNFVYPDGATPEQIQDELMDYHQYIDETSKVYGHITGGRISKPNTMAFEVISIYDDEVTDIENRAEKAEDALKDANEDAANLYRALFLADEFISQKYGSTNRARTDALDAHRARVGKKEGEEWVNDQQT